MMDMMSTGVVATLLVVVLLAGAAVYTALRVMGAREVEGDHPGEPGYRSPVDDHDD